MLLLRLLRIHGLVVLRPLVGGRVLLAAHYVRRHLDMRGVQHLRAAHHLRVRARVLAGNHLRVV